MNPIRQALYERLVADAVLTSMLSSSTAVYHGTAPQTAAFPFVTFQRPSGLPVWQFQGAHHQNDLWIVKGVSRGSSATLAEDIDKRIDVVLTDAPLVIAGGVLLGIWRELDVPAYPETESGEQYWHAGAQYRLVSQPA